MDHYFELKALPNPEIIQSAVVAQLVQYLHRLLPDYAGRVALGFPAYGQQNTLGGIIRLYGPSADIEELHDQVEISAFFSDYALITAIAKIPDQVKSYAKFQRYRTKGNSHLNRLKKRHEMRGSWTEALQQKIEQKFSKPVNLPYLHLTSASTGQRFILFIKKTTQTKPGSGQFSSYGLSLKEATVPIF